MSKPFTYWIRLALVVTLCIFTTFSPALAGKWIDRLLHRDCKPECCPAPVCEEIFVSACEPASICDCTPSAATPSAMETPKVEPPAVESSASPTPSLERPKTELPPAEPSKVDLPKIEQPVEPAPKAPPVVPPVAETPPPAAETPAVQPPTVEKPAVQPPVTEPPLALPPAVEAPIVQPPVAETPAVPEPAIEKPIGEPPVSAPAEVTPEKPGTQPKAEGEKPADPLGDIFGEPAKPKAETPNAETPKSDAAAVEPTKTDEPKPVAPLGDIFGDSEKPADAPKKSDSSKPSEQLEDIFSTPATKDAKPGEIKPTELPPTKPAPVESKPSDAPKSEPAKPASEPSLDDIFGKPTSTNADPLFDSLFRPRETKPAAPTPATKERETDLPKSTPPAPPPKSKDELNKLFGIGSFTPPSQFRGAEYKTWVDNTGTYTVNGRLTTIYSDKVKILKENGKTTTVPLSRLSDRDFSYVQWVASSLTVDSAAKLVKKSDEPVSTDSVR